MLCARISQGKILIGEEDVPQASGQEIVVRMEYCGVCGTDLEKLEGVYTASMPVIGHETSGVITQVGSEVQGLMVGDRVFAHHHVPCYNCWRCNHGSTTMCEHYRATNIFPGGFSEYFRVPSWNVEHGGVLKIPEHVSMKAASFIEPLGCVLRSLRRCQAYGDERVLIVGGGPMGALHALVLRSTTNCKLMFSEPSEYRAGFLRNAGFELATPDRRDFDLAIVATGSPAGIKAALQAVRPGGKVCLFGVPYKGSQLDYDVSNLVNLELSLTSSNAADDRDTREALRLIETGTIKPEELVTHEFPLTEVDKAFQAAKSANAMKVLVTSGR